MPWQIDPDVLDALRSNKAIDHTLLRKIFGPSDPSVYPEETETISDYPYSLAYKLSGHVTPQDFASGLAFGCDLDIMSNDVAETTDGVLTGWVDVTVHGAVPDGSTDNYAALLAAINAAAAGPKIVWFPRTIAGTTYHFACPSGVHGLPIYPGVQYKAAQGVILRRTDTVNNTDDTAAIFNTTPESTTPDFGGETVIFDGFSLNCAGGAAGNNGLGRHGIVYDPDGSGGSVIVRNCTVYNAYYNAGSTYARTAISISGATYASVKNCRISTSNRGIVATGGTRYIRNCTWRRDLSTIPDVAYGIVVTDIADYFPFALVENCHLTGGVSSPAVGIDVTTTVGRVSIMDNTVSLYPFEATGTHLQRGIQIAGIGVTVTGNVVSPKMQLALKNYEIGINCTNTTRCAITNNVVAADRAAGTTASDLQYGIVSSGAYTRGNTIIGNVVRNVSLKPITSRERSNVNSTTDNRADLTRFDAEINSVCAVSTDYADVVDTTEPYTFQPVGHGVSLSPRVLYAADRADGTQGLYIGGDMLKAGAYAVNHAAKWDGNTWKPFHTAGGVHGFNGYVNAFLKIGQRLYVGGSYTQKTEGSALPQLSYTDNDGDTLEKFESTPEFNGLWKDAGTTAGTCLAMAQWGQYIVIAGQFQYIKLGANFIPTKNVVLYDYTAKTFTAMSPGPGEIVTDFCSCICVLDDNRLVVGGRISTIAAVPKPAGPPPNHDNWNIAQCTMTSGPVFTWTPFTAAWFSNTESIEAITQLPNGYVMIGGTTTKAWMSWEKKRDSDSPPSPRRIWSAHSIHGLTVLCRGGYDQQSIDDIPAGQWIPYSPLSSDYDLYRPLVWGTSWVRADIYGFYQSRNSGLTGLILCKGKIVQYKYDMNRQGIIEILGKTNLPGGEQYQYDFKCATTYRNSLILGGTFGPVPRIYNQLHDQRAWGMDANIQVQG